MGKFEIGSVVLVSFPFSNLKGQKLRPALVVAKVEFGDVILCQITSKSYSSEVAIPIGKIDFSEGGLPIMSFVRPDKLFTADVSIIKSVAGMVNKKKKMVILQRVRDLFHD